jgi:hypothetical protein
MKSVLPDCARLENNIQPEDAGCNRSLAIARPEKKNDKA